MAAVQKTQAERRGLAVAVCLLLAAAVASNAYLLLLWLKVNRLGAETVQSFCSLGEGLDCVAVATSNYSAFLGIPVAVYGLEYFGLVLALCLVGLSGRTAMRQWASLVFWAMLVALPASVIMAWIALTCIRSLCILCSVVYSVNGLLLLLLGISHARQFGELFSAAPREWRSLLKRRRTLVGTLLVLVVAVSQIAWLPRLFGSAEQAGPTSSLNHLAGKGMAIGPADARVRIIEYSDFQCPVCSRAHHVVLEVMQRYPDRIYFEHRDFPLDQSCNPIVQREFHRHACQAAFYARCADKQGKFWPYAHRLFANQGQLAGADLRRYGEEVGLDVTALAHCVASPAIQQLVQRDIAEGIALGITGTPTYVLNGEVMTGAPALSFWLEKVGALLEAAPK